MSKLRIKDAPLLPNIDGTEKIPTGGKGDYAVSVDQIKTYARGGLPQQLEDHINDTENPHQVSKSQVGLGNVDNTSDVDKPISTATQEALDLKANTLDVDNALNLKANIEDINVALSLKSDKSYVDSQDSLKADKVYVNNALSFKANIDDVGVELTLKADKTYVDSQDSLKADKTYVDSAFSNLSTTANKYYSTLAAANADIANIALNQSVTIGEAENGGLWYKATAGATSLTKSPYDAVEQAKVDATTKANAAEVNAKTEAKEYINERVAKVATSGIHPIIADGNGNSPLWLDEGKIGLTELEEQTKIRVKSQVGLGESALLNFIPIVVDRNDDCPLWLQNGLLNFAGIHANAVRLIKEQFGAIDPIDPQKTNNVTGAAYPIVSDGASLRQWKSKASKLKSGLTQQLRVIVTGDSWAEHKTITNELTAILREAFGSSGSGWINVAPENNQLDGISVSKSGGWTLQDLNTVSTFTHGTSADGFTLFSSTAGSTITASNITNAETATIFYGKTTGSFSYSVNGAAEVMVTVDSSGAAQQMKSIAVSGTSNIVVKVISGTVAIFGFHARKTGSGVEVTKLGNGSCTGKDYSKISPTVQVDIGGYLSPDVVVIMLGTNDYRISGNTVETYKAGISAMIDGYRTNNPYCGFILIAPADSKATPVVPLSNYHDAIYALAKDKQVEFYNMYDDWDVWSVENNNGQWADSLHVSKSGAYRISKKLFKNFLEV